MNDHSLSICACVWKVADGIAKKLDDKSRVSDKVRNDEDDESKNVDDCHDENQYFSTIQAISIKVVSLFL